MTTTQTTDIFFIIDRRKRTPGIARWAIHVVSNNAGQAGRTVRAINHFTDERLARCSGGGYDMEGTVIADAVDVLIGRACGIPSINGARGTASVIAYYAEHGIDIYRASDALWRL